jgi:flagellar basal-body rod protein FlgB
MAVLERVLDLRMRAHEIYGSNIANANVPGFKAKKIDFEDRMREAVDALGQESRPLLDRETEVKILWRQKTATATLSTPNVNKLKSPKTRLPMRPPCS